jgi:ATP-dependent Clp protease ATP-binding subunit ClpC
VFNTLEKHDIDLIIEIELKKLYARLTELGYVNLLRKQKLYCRKGFDKQFGARPLKRAIQKYVEDSPLKRLLLLSIETKFSWIEEGAQELNVK